MGPQVAARPAEEQGGAVAAAVLVESSPTSGADDSGRQFLRNQRREVSLQGSNDRTVGLLSQNERPVPKGSVQTARGLVPQHLSAHCARQTRHSAVPGDDYHPSQDGRCKRRLKRIRDQRKDEFDVPFP